MSFRRTSLGVISSVTTSPPVMGALYVLALAAIAARRGSGDDADLGDMRRADAVESFIAHRFAGEITRMKIGIVAAAIGLGLVVGLVAELVIFLRKPGRSSFARRLARSVIVCAAVHAALFVWAMADSPQLYAANWYAQGGWARTVQVIATDYLGSGGVIVVALLAAVIYIRPSAIVSRLKRVGALARRAAAPSAALAIFAFAPPVTAPSAPPPAIASKGETKSETKKKRMNLLVLAADSLRADTLDTPAAAHLGALAAKSARFDRAYVSIPRTFPSWVTILTGRHAHHHGVRTMFPTWEDRARDFDAVPARLAKAGWQTGVVSDYAGDIFGRIDLGFSRVDTPSFDFRQLIRQRALERETPLLPILHSQLGRRLFPVMRELNDAADPMLLADDVTTAMKSLSRDEDKPFFLTVFFSTAHFPYAAPAPYYRAFTNPDYRGRFKYHKPVGLVNEGPPDAADIAQIRGLYAGAVQAIDDAAGRVLASLASLGLADSTIVIVTADHGETLYDNGHGQGHGDHLFGDEGTHVPLVIYDPRANAPGRRTPIVRDVDIAPTIYDLLGVEAPRDLDGRSLAPSVTNASAKLDERFAYAETELWFTEDIPSVPQEMRIPYPGIMALTELDSRHNAEIVLRRDMMAPTLMARHRMIRDEDWKLVYVPTRTGVKYMLYDVVKDKGEVHDVAAAHPDQVKRMTDALWKWMLEDPTMEKRDGFLVPRDSRAR